MLLEAGDVPTEMGKIGPSDLVRYFCGDCLLSCISRRKSCKTYSFIQLRGVYSFSSHAPKWFFFSFVYISWSWKIAHFASWLKKDFKLEEMEKLADHFIWDQFQNQVPCIQSWNILNLAFRENYNAYLSDQASVGRRVLWKHHIMRYIIIWVVVFGLFLKLCILEVSPNILSKKLVCSPLFLHWSIYFYLVE